MKTADFLVLFYPPETILINNLFTYKFKKSIEFIYYLQLNTIYSKTYNRNNSKLTNESIMKNSTTLKSKFTNNLV